MVTAGNAFVMVTAGNAFVMVTDQEMHLLWYRFRKLIVLVT
jgi:hypothetical protein